METINHLFTYGSLMCADIMQRVAGCRAQSTEAALRDFFRSAIHREDYPGIVPRPGATVAGVLYLNQPTEAVRRLDVFEGELYERREVEVVSPEYGACAAMAYVIKDCYRDRLNHKEWSYAQFLATGKAKFEKAYLGFDRI